MTETNSVHQKQGPVYADIERKKAEARQIRANHAGHMSDEEDNPPSSLFDLPIKREAHDDVATRAKNLLGCYDSVKNSIQSQSRDLIGVRSGPQTPGLPPQGSLFSPPHIARRTGHQKSASSSQRSSSGEKRRSRSHCHDSSFTGGAPSPQTPTSRQQRDPQPSKETKVKEHKEKSHAASDTTGVVAPNKESHRHSKKPNLHHLKIKNEGKSLADPHPPVDHILQEMKSIDQPLTAIHTPRTEDCKFPFHREDVSGGRHSTNKNQLTPRDRPNIFSSISSKSSSKSSKERKSSVNLVNSSNESPSSDSSGSDSDSSSDDDRASQPPARDDVDDAADDDEQKLSWSLDSLIQNMKKTSPGTILETPSSENPPTTTNSRRNSAQKRPTPSHVAPTSHATKIDVTSDQSDESRSDDAVSDVEASPISRRRSSKSSREKKRRNRVTARGSVTPENRKRTKPRVRSDSTSDEEIDVEATTPIKQSVTQASKLKLSQTHKRHHRRSHSKFIQNDVVVTDNAEKSTRKVPTSHKLLDRVEYVNGIPKIMVRFEMDLIGLVPGRKSPGFVVEQEEASPEPVEADRESGCMVVQDMDISSEDEGDEGEIVEEKDDAADVPTAVSPIKTPSQLPSFCPSPKMTKRKHCESPSSEESGLNKRCRSGVAVSSSSHYNRTDPFTRSLSPARAQDPYTKLAAPQWVEETSNASNRSSSSYKIRDWDAPSQSTYRPPEDLWSNVVVPPTQFQAAPHQVDPFRAENKSPSANNYLEDARKLKHQADKLNDILTKSLTYLESALCFIQCGNAMEEEQALNPNPSMTAIQKMYKDTLALIRRILRGRVSDSGDKEGKLHVLSNRIQAILHLKLFKLGKREAVKMKMIIDDYSKSQSKPSTVSTQAPSPYGSQGWPRSSGTPSPISPSPSPASVGSVGSQCSDMAVSRLTTGHYSTSSQTGSGTTPTGSNNGTGSTIAIPQRIHSVTHQYIATLNNLYLCHDLWDQADVQASLHKDFFRELDHHCGELTLHSSILSLVKYVRLGLHRLKDT